MTASVSWKLARQGYPIHVSIVVYQVNRVDHGRQSYDLRAVVLLLTCSELTRPYD